MSDATSLAQLDGVVEFLRAAERLKVTHRSAYTSEGQVESVAEHSWRLCLMALVLRDAFPDVNFAKLISMCVIHDLGEAIGGDVPAPEQARRRAEDPAASKSAAEREDLLAAARAASLPAAGRDHRPLGRVRGGHLGDGARGQGARQAGDDSAAHAGRQSD